MNDSAQFRGNPVRLGATRFVAVILVLSPVVVRAQSLDRADTVASVSKEDGRDSFTIIGAVTFANGSIKGDSFDRDLFLAGIRYSRVFVRNGALTLSFTPEIIPAAWLSQPIVGDAHEAVQRSIPRFTHMETTYGAGASPIGLELNFRPNGKLQPLAGTNEGFLYFGRSVPSPFAAQFNFTVEVRFGLRVRLDHGKALSFDYAYHHLSNLYRAPQNPGVDTQMVCFGYVRILNGS